MQATQKQRKQDARRNSLLTNSSQSALAALWSRPIWMVAVLGLLPAACGAQLSQSVEPPASLPQVASAEQVAQADLISDEPPEIASPYGAYLAGLAAANNRDFTTASDYLLKALEADPENLELSQTVFMLVAADGRQGDAKRLADRLTETQPDFALANVVLAVDAATKEDWQKADQILAKLPDEGLSSLLAPLMRGWIDIAMNDPDAAMDHIAALQETSGFALLYDLHYAVMNDVAGRTQAAREGYKKALDSGAGGTLRLSWLSGNFYERSDEPEKAAEIYRRFLQNASGSTLMEPLLERVESGKSTAPAVATPKDGLAEVLFNIASLLSQERASDLALIYVRQALALRPDFDMAQVLLGEIMESQGRGEDALAAYEQLDSGSPFSWMVGLRIAEALEELDNSERALSELDRLAAERPDHFEPLFRKGNLLRSQERFEEAVEAYNGAEARLGELVPRYWSLLYFRGIALERSDQWSLAEEDFLKALDLEPEQPFVMNYLAYSWVEQNVNLEEAEEMLIRAVELRPDDGYIVDSLGWAYYRLGDYDNAVRYLEQAVELRPQDSVINDHLGDALWFANRRMEARFQWRRALNLEPEDDQVPLIEEKLRSGLKDEPKDI
ncbi:MAG: tetratricopeptide repeat protein [Pseudomonadota bacterium]